MLCIKNVHLFTTKLIYCKHFFNEFLEGLGSRPVLFLYMALSFYCFRFFCSLFIKTLQTQLKIQLLMLSYLLIKSSVFFQFATHIPLSIQNNLAYITGKPHFKTIILGETFSNFVKRNMLLFLNQCYIVLCIFIVIYESYTLYF